MRWIVLALLLEMVARAPGTEPALANDLAQGDAEVIRGNLRAALVHFAAAEKIDPNSVDVLLRISQQNSDLVASAKTPAEAQKLAQTSLAYAQRALALAPQNAKAHLATAVAYGRLTDFENDKTKLEDSRRVKAEAEKAAALDPREDFAYHVLGVWNFRVANLNAVLKLMAKIIYGGVPDASNEEAVRNLQKAIELAPQRIIHHEELAHVYLAMGKRELARNEWQTVAALPAQNAEDEKAQRAAKTALGASLSVSTPARPSPPASSNHPAE